MYILQNALKNVARNKGRNILMATVIFAIIVTTVVALIINNTTNGIIDDYKTRFGSQVSISVDIEKWRTGGAQSGGLPQITPQQSLAFADSEYIKDYVMQVMIGTASETLRGKDQGLGGNTIAGGNEMIVAQFYLTNVFYDFEIGQRGITSGKMVEKDNECLVSEEFAAINGLSVNDTVTLTASLHDGSGANRRLVTYELTVVGIYYDLTDEYAGIQVSASNRRNQILTTTATIFAPVREGEGGFYVTTTYFLKNPSMIKDFEAEVRAKGLSEFLKAKTDERGYNSIVAPVEGLRSISLTFMIIVLALGAVILVLISTIAIRERKYEIGVLRAMGMKKSKVALGLWFEMVVITCICLCFGLACGMLAAQPVSDTLLTRQVEAVKASGGVPVGAIPSADASSLLAGSLTTLKELDVSLGLITAFEIVGISLLLSSIAGTAAMSKITKYEPIKILMERN